MCPSDTQGIYYGAQQRGVQQGSVLGPSLFLIDLNGLCNLQLDKGKDFAFANNTTLLFRAHRGKYRWNRARSSYEMDTSKFDHP